MTDIRKFINIVESNLNEALPLSTAKRYVGLRKKYNENEYDAIFTRFAKYGRGKKNPQRIYFPLNAQKEPPIDQYNDIRHNVTSNLIYLKTLYFGDSYSTSTSLTNEVRRLATMVPQLSATWKKLKELDYHSLPLDLYKKGLIQIGKRQVKIGKIFEDLIKSLQIILTHIRTLNPEDNQLGAYNWQKNGTIGDNLESNINTLNNLYKQFQNDPSRSAVKSSYYIVISRHPYDIAGMSTDRGWRSCTHLENGQQRVYVLSYVQNGNLIAYLIKDGDWNIKSPTSRQLICRYNNTRNSSDYIFWPQESAYGASSAAFDRFIQVFCKWINRGKDDGLYEPKDDQQYIGTAHKSGTEVDIRGEKNNNRHNPNDPDDEDYDEDNYNEDGYEDEYEDEDEDEDDRYERERREAEPPYDYLRREFNNHGATDVTVRLLKSVYEEHTEYQDTYGDSENNFEEFRIIEDNNYVIIESTSFDNFLDRDAGDSIVSSLYDLYVYGGDLDTGDLRPANIISDRDIYDAIDHLPVSTYQKFMQKLNVKPIDHQDDNYHKALKKAVDNLKSNTEMWGDFMEGAISSKMTEQGKEFVKNRLREYIDYGWKGIDERINIGLYNGERISSEDFKGKCVSYLEIDDAFQVVYSQEISELKNKEFNVNLDAIEERQGKMPSTVYATISTDDNQKSLFSDNESDTEGFPLVGSKDDATFMDDPAVAAYIRSIATDTRMLSQTLSDIINKNH